MSHPHADELLLFANGELAELRLVEVASHVATVIHEAFGDRLRSMPDGRAGSGGSIARFSGPDSRSARPR